MGSEMCIRDRHHAGMLPKYRRLVERLAQAGLLKVICGTDTLGVGINVPIRTVLFTALSKYDGTKTRHLSAREFHQIAGRAGRAGFDTVGHVVVEAPEHEIENARLVRKAGDDPKLRRKVVRKRPPEGFVSWGEPTFERLVAAAPEPLTSSFAVSHAMLINVIARPGDACTAMRRLLKDNHEPRPAQHRHTRRAIALYRGLRAAGVVEVIDAPDAEGRRLRLTVDLQPNFALNQPLSAFALATFELLDVEAPEYPLDVLSVIESTLDNPTQVLSAQRFKARGEAVAQMKADNVEYEERMVLLESVTYPKPLVDLLEAAFSMYRAGHPWVADHVVEPKSVARDLYERAMTFADFIGHYNLARSEGLVLRYLTDAYKALNQTVPDEAKTEELRDLTAWLGELVRQVDSSLLDEWEHARAGVVEPPAATRATLPPAPPALTANRRAFTVMVRNAAFHRVELAARRAWDELERAGGGWSAERWRESLGPYSETHGAIGTGAVARGPGLFQVDTRDDHWLVRQVLDDALGDHDWALVLRVDLAASDEAGAPAVEVVALTNEV